MDAMQETATLGGGCFWCLEAVFLPLRGVERVESGYAGGAVANPSYEAVCSGTTGHAEVVQVTFDPKVISFRDLLDVFFTIHDPTTPDRQGHDVGTQYRSAIFYTNEEQKRVANAYIEQLNKSKAFARPVVTQVSALNAYYKAEAHHQDYAIHHPDDAYIVYNDLPKVENLRKQLPDLYTSK